MARPLRPLSQRRPARAQISAEQLASLSHDFRTPLNGVLGMARLLEGTRLTGEQRAYVAALRESGQHLLTLVNDVLDFAKLGATEVELHPEAMEVEVLLRGVCELLSPRAREKGLEIAWAAPAEVGRIVADDGRLRQILLNFAGNAIKFTEKGGVLVAADVVGGVVRFTVSDSGPGVPDADLDRIFEAFAQGDGRETALAGAGLGLAIARRLARAMGGDVGAENRVEGGAVFWMEAPLPIAPDPMPGRLLPGRRVAVVSPSAVVRDAAAGQIRACGGQALTAGRLSDLGARAAADEVVLVDHALAAKGRLARPAPLGASIVLLAPEDRGLIERYRQAGFAGYLIKPLRRNSLAERVLIALGQGMETPEAPADERAVAAVATGVRVLLVEDHPINALLASTLLSREGCVVDQARGGEEALSAVQVGRYDLILMDMRMPGLSGEATARRLREAGVKTPIVALTANAFEDDRRACLAAGMDDFLVKPLSPDALRGALRRWAAPRPADAAPGGGWTGTAARAKVG